LKYVHVAAALIAANQLSVTNVTNPGKTVGRQHAGPISAPSLELVRNRNQTADIHQPITKLFSLPLALRIPMLESLHQEPMHRVPFELPLIPPGSVLQTNEDGYIFPIEESESRTFFCTLTVFDQIEQESLDVSIWGSPDGLNFGKRPVLRFPQQFYRGIAKMVLDVSLRPELKFVRARWEVNRWGRVAPTPMFVAGLQLEEIPPMSRDTPTKRAILAAK
jgi:hypothetical protein